MPQKPPGLPSPDGPLVPFRCCGPANGRKKTQRALRTSRLISFSSSRGRICLVHAGTAWTCSTRHRVDRIGPTTALSGRIAGPGATNSAFQRMRSTDMTGVPIAYPCNTICGWTFNLMPRSGRSISRTVVRSARRGAWGLQPPARPTSRSRAGMAGPRASTQLGHLYGT